MNTEERKKETTALLPGNKMQLIDGREIDIFPRQQMQEGIDNTLQFSTTDELLSYRNNTAQKVQLPNSPSEEGLQFFLDNVFFFVAHYEEILSDSRMFLAPVPVKNGVAYSGSEDFQLPTLGVYLEWWSHYGQTITLDEHNQLQFYWYVSGSPLSGSNACSVVNERGECTTRPVSCFIQYWKPFAYVNTRYEECKMFGEAYTLQQVKQILNQTDKGDNHNIDDYHTKANLNGYRWLACYLQQQHEEDLRNAREMQKKTTYLHMDLHSEELYDILSEYKSQTRRNEYTLKQLRQQVHEMKDQLKRGEVSAKEYQQYVSPRKKEIERLDYEPRAMADRKLDHILHIYNEHVRVSDLIAWNNERITQNEIK